MNTNICEKCGSQYIGFKCPLCTNKSDICIVCGKPIEKGKYCSDTCRMVGLSGFERGKRKLLGQSERSKLNQKKYHKEYLKKYAPVYREKNKEHLRKYQCEYQRKRRQKIKKENIEDEKN